jgi:hypothetical protein
MRPFQYSGSNSFFPMEVPGVDSRLLKRLKNFMNILLKHCHVSRQKKHIHCYDQSVNMAHETQAMCSSET